jgi:putative membrane-bound dehydrogenase-like protein
MMMRLFLFLLIGLSCRAADTRLVRETEAFNPREERAALHVPEGFEIQLFACEPQINKPINMAFDTRGRLWVSSTVEYPYAADKSRWSDPLGSRVKDSRDAIKILEDTDGDGRADKVNDFADGLNIPTGVLPWHRPEHKSGCIAWSIPNIWYFGDSDGDDKADVREVIFGPLGYEKDTHGMCSSFRLGLDGWVYATHGFSNTSQFKAKDGSQLELQSGNVFRFKPDGSRVEPWTHGQVNPFGLCWDRYGNLYSADCHSSPIYQLIRGAHYPSFGKPHDGLGFAPVMCQHTHGSTGICGIVYIDGGIWGPEWDDHMLVGNVVTSKVNRDHVTFTGSTPKANEQPDFLTSDDPWFRPVDLQLGPDNALYIADFYNRIIGHYEVPLEHPGRDKERGRIWRVKRSKSGPSSKAKDDPEITLIRHLRELANGPPLRTLPPELKWDALKIPEDSRQVQLSRALALRNMAPEAKLRFEALVELDVIRNRFADVADLVLRHACLISERDLFIPETGLIDLLPMGAVPLPSLGLAMDLEQILLSLPQAAASRWLLKHQTDGVEDQSKQNERLAHAARFGLPEDLDSAIAIATSLPAERQLGAVHAIHEALAERGMPSDVRIVHLAQKIAHSLIANLSSKIAPSWATMGEAKWSLQPRKCADGAEAAVLQSMNKGGGDEESRTGALKSKTFPAPAKLTIWINGHRGAPKNSSHTKNVIHVRESETGQILASAFPPRSDIAKQVEFDLKDHMGKPITLEVVDGDDGKAYAWLGITRIEPAVVSVNDFQSADTTSESLKTLAVMLQHSAPAALREKLAAYLPPRPAPPPLPVSPEQRKQLDDLVAFRVAAFAKAKPNLEIGANVFKMTCAACHQIRGEGGLIGPQLDGIGARGPARLCEDILDPNRNVDAHFHLHTLTLKDHSTFSGFLKAEVGQVLILADATGREHRIAKKDVSQDLVIPTSLMPPTFGQSMAEADFLDLLGYLMNEKVAR